jgi:hypothetical protein
MSMGKIAWVIAALGAPLAWPAQAAVQVCQDGRVMAISPFNPNPCGTAPAPASGNGALTCEDGRAVRPTPFNPDPCRVSAPAAPQRIPDEFLALFGDVPRALGLEVEDRLAEEAYRARYERFVGPAPEPEGFAGVGPRYFAAGLGPPGFYEDRSGARVRWPNAPFYPAEASVAETLANPEAVIATWQAQAILRGGVLENVSPALPATVRTINQERLEGSAREPARTPALLTWGAYGAALALHEIGPELVGPASAAKGVLTQPAHPGELIRLFATGLDGATRIEASLNGVPLAPEDFAFTQIGPNLWCLVVRTPANSSSGELAVQVIADGVASSAGPYLTVSR